MPDPDLTPDEFAAALAKLRPAPAAAAKPSFLFLAGRASRDAIVRRWKVVAAVVGLALVASWGFGYVQYRELRQRVTTAETRAEELRSALAKAQAPPVATTPAPTVPVPVPVPTPVPVQPSYAEPDPTPQELADALRQRNDILTAGLTLLPQSKPPDAVAGDIRQALPGGVFATPWLEPKKPMSVEPGDE